MKEWLQKIKEQAKEKNAKVYFVVFLGLLGMALILISELFSVEDAAVLAANEKEQTSSTVVQEASLSSQEAYRVNLEASLTALIEQMEGAGQTSVMITLISGEEMIYAQDKIIGESQSSESHVLLENGEALCETTLTPTICGVAVLCEGGDNIMVKAKIITMVSALFDISSNHVTVEKMSGNAVG